MRFKYANAAGTYTISNVSHLGRVVVGTPVNTATVTLRFASSDDAFSVITCSGAVPFDLEYDLHFDTAVNIEIVLSGATDVLVSYE